MKIVFGFFENKDVIPAVRELIDSGFSYDDLSMMSSVADIPDYLQSKPEEAASSGAGVGAAVGGTAGAVSSIAASAIPGFESMFVTGLMATAVGGVIGGYLGSLYSVRAESQTELDMHHELANGRILVIAKVADEGEAETAVSLMKRSKGQHVEIHTIE